MKKKIFVLFCVLIFSIVFVAQAIAATIDYAAEISNLKTRQEHAHQIAEHARAIGYAEDSDLIETVRAEWWADEAKIVEYKRLQEEQEAAEEEAWKIENERNARIIASVVYNEAMFGTTQRHKELVAAVIINRVNDPRFPNTVYDVVTQPGQYLPAYANESSYYFQRAVNDTENWNLCMDIAYKALKGEIECPSNVLYQSNYSSLGYGYYEVCYTSYSVTYFAYG